MEVGIIQIPTQNAIYGIWLLVLQMYKVEWLSMNNICQADTNIFLTMRNIAWNLRLECEELFRVTTFSTWRLGLRGWSTVSWGPFTSIYVPGIYHLVGGACVILSSMLKRLCDPCLGHVVTASVILVWSILLFLFKGCVWPNIWAFYNIFYSKLNYTPDDKDTIG